MKAIASPREFFHVVHFEGKMRQVRPHHHRSALVELAELNFFFAGWRFQKNKLRAATRNVAANLLQAEDVFIERDRLLQIGHAVTSM